MEPFYFDTQPGSLFGIYHPPVREQVRTVGVVLCYPMGQEYLRAHRAFRHLGECLAGQGFPTLRFDYFGCGDSEGACEEGTLAQWRRDIIRAVDTLQSGSEISQVALVGLRLGGALALDAAASVDTVSSVLLWDPIVSGVEYVRKLAALERTWLQQSFVRKTPRHSSKDPDESTGFPLTPSVKQELRALDLLRGPIDPPEHLGIVTCQEGGRYDAFVSQLQKTGLSVGVRFIPESKVWIKDKNQLETRLVPRKTIQAIVSWLCEVDE